MPLEVRHRLFRIKPKTSALFHSGFDPESLLLHPD